MVAKPRQDKDILVKLGIHRPHTTTKIHQLNGQMLVLKPTIAETQMENQRSGAIPLIKTKDGTIAIQLVIKTKQ